MAGSSIKLVGADANLAEYSRTRVQAPLHRTERFASNHRFGDMTGARLTQIMQSQESGDLADHCDFVEHVLTTDSFVAGLAETLAKRVSQAPFRIVAGGPEPADMLAAELVNEVVRGIDNFADILEVMLINGKFAGISFHEVVWAFDSSRRTYYPEDIAFRHGHRFRFDEHWLPRLWDRGSRTASGAYGEALIPENWIVHQPATVGYPGTAGLMRRIAWKWLFLRWSSKFEIKYLDTLGTPLIYARVPANTADNVIAEILTQLESLAADHVGVIKEGGEIVIDATGANATTGSNHDAYAKRAEAALTRDILGTSDAAGPGENGARAAVETRTASTMDPRMLADGRSLMNTLRGSLFKWVVLLNSHKFGGATPAIPVGTFEAKESDNAPVGLAGAQNTSLLEIVRAVREGVLSEDGAIAQITAAFPGIDDARARRIVSPVLTAPRPPAGSVVDPGLATESAPAITAASDGVGQAVDPLALACLSRV